MTRYVDNRLCRDGVQDYSIAGRSCGGNDGIGYRTVAGAMAAASPGETLVFRAGTYMERTQWNASPRREGCFRVTKPLTFARHEAESVVLTYDPANTPIMDAADWGPILTIESNLVMQGIRVIGTRALGDSPGGADTDVAVSINNNGTLEWTDCTVEGFGHCGVKANRANGRIKLVGGRISDGGFTGRDHGIYISEPNQNDGRSIFEGIEIARNAGYGVHLYGTPRGCVLDSLNIHHNGGAYTPLGGGGILLGGSGGHLVRNCQVVDNHAGAYGGIVLWKAQSLGNAFIGNTILRNGVTNLTFDAAGVPNVCYGNTRHAFPASGLGKPNDPLAWPDYGTDVIV